MYDSSSCLVVVKTKSYLICSWFSFLSSSSDPPIFHSFSLPLLICHSRTSPGWAEKQGVLVHSGNYNKTPQTAGLRNNRNVFSQSSGGQKSEIRVLAGPCSRGNLWGRMLPPSSKCLEVFAGLPWHSLVFQLQHCNFCFSCHVTVLPLGVSVPFFEGQQS